MNFLTRENVQVPVFRNQGLNLYYRTGFGDLQERPISSIDSYTK